MNRFKVTVLFSGALLLLLPGPQLLAAKKCKGTKVLYKGRCLYPRQVPKKVKAREGTLGGRCYGNYTCNTGLKCVHRRCIRTVAKSGTRGGPCYGNSTCNSGLACIAGLCKKPTPKQAGTEGGPCYGNKTCNSGLACLHSVCKPGPNTGRAEPPKLPGLWSTYTDGHRFSLRYPAGWSIKTIYGGGVRLESAPHKCTLYRSPTSWRERKTPRRPGDIKGLMRKMDGGRGQLLDQRDGTPQLGQGKKPKQDSRVAPVPPEKIGVHQNQHPGLTYHNNLLSKLRRTNRVQLTNVRVQKTTLAGRLAYRTSHVSFTGGMRVYSFVLYIVHRGELYRLNCGSIIQQMPPGVRTQIGGILSGLRLF